MGSISKKKMHTLQLNAIQRTQSQGRKPSHFSTEVTYHRLGIFIELQGLFASFSSEFLRPGNELISGASNVKLPLCHFADNIPLQEADQSRHLSETQQPFDENRSREQ